MTALFSASQVNLLIYHYLKESGTCPAFFEYAWRSNDADKFPHHTGLHHACFALRHESRLDEEPLSHQAIVAPGRLIEVLEKGLAYLNVEAHIDEVRNGFTPYEMHQTHT